MNNRDLILQVYQRMPYAVRSGIAGLHGRRLAAWRYGAQTETLVQQALDRDYWTAAQWTEWHRNQLAEMLPHALKTVPFYRQRESKSIDTTYDTLEALQQWNILDKEALRAEPRRFVAEDAPPRLVQEQTSGTTGKPISLWYSQETAQQWYALVEARWRRWYGVTRQDRWGILGGRLIASLQQQSPPFWVWNFGFRQLYLSVYHLSSQNIPHYLKAIRDHRVRYLYGYTSALTTLAQEMLAQNLPRPELTVIVTNAEPLLDHQRELIREAFDCPVRETYGMSEMAAGASECEHGRMHVWSDAGYTEILDEQGEPVYDAPGEVITTGLLNRAMPLIRYRTGDRAVQALPDERCPCGRTLPVLKRIEGRSDDVLYTPDGRQVGRLDPVFKADLAIREAQIIQEHSDFVRVLIVPAPSYSALHADNIRRRLQERLGAVEIAVETVEAIPRTANGKFRAVMCCLSDEEKTAIRQSGASKR